jgi:hypothetical protein
MHALFKMEHSTKGWIEERCCTDEGVEIRCPVCGTAWLTDIQGDVTFDAART